jgi:hypothetical protein
VYHTVPSGDGATSCGALPAGTVNDSNDGGCACANPTVSAAHTRAEAKDAASLNTGDAGTFLRRAMRSMHGGHRALPACANVPGSFEKGIPLEGHTHVATVGATTLQRDELVLDQCLDIRAVQFRGFGTLVDQEQDGKFMGTQHSRLQHVWLVADGCP